LVIIEPSYGCYILDQVHLNNLRLDIQTPMLDITMAGDRYRHRIPTGLRTIEMQMNLTAQNFQQQKEFDLFDLKMIRKLTIIELFQIVQQRMNERENI
jgi:hypothetical protein